MKEDWLKQKELLNQQGLNIIWFYTYYLENLNKSSINLKLSVNEFHEHFQGFLQMLNIQIAFQDTSDLKTLFPNNKSYYISVNSIVKKVVDYFNEKYK